MLKILFDFEIDEQLKRSHSVTYYEAIRNFFLQRFSSCELEMMLYVDAGDYAVIMIRVSENQIEAIPLNIPDHLMTKMNRCIRKQHIETLQVALSAIEDDNAL